MSGNQQDPDMICEIFVLARKTSRTDRLTAESEPAASRRRLRPVAQASVGAPVTASQPRLAASGESSDYWSCFGCCSPSLDSGAFLG
jgi:hypothetical protein